MPLSDRQKQLAAQAEKENGLPAGLLTRLIEKESSGNPNALSPAGARGSVQFMPQTAKQYGVDPNNDDSAIPGSGKMLADLSKKYNGNMRAALAHYNGGAFNAQRELDGSDTARPDKVSAANNIANKKYVGFFNDILGGGGDVNSSMPTVGGAAPMPAPTQGQQPNMNAQQIVELMKQMQNPSVADNSTPVNQTDVLPSALSDPYAGTTQSAANPANPRAAGISTGDPSNVNAAIDEYMKRYHDRLPVASLAQAFSGFGGGGAGMVNAAAQPWTERDKKDYLDTVGRIGATQDAAKASQDLANSGQKSELERANFAQTAPGANLNAATQKNLGNPNSVLSAGIKNSIISKMRAAGVPVDPALANMTGMEAITTYGKYIPEIQEALKLPSNVSQSQSAAAKSSEEAKQASQQTRVGGVAVNAAEAPATPNVTKTTSGTNVSTGPSAAATARDTFGASAGAKSASENATNFANQSNTIAQLRTAISSAKPYQNTPGATIYDAVNSGQREMLQQMVKDAAAQGIQAPEPTAPQAVWRNFIEQADSRIGLTNKKEQSRQEAIGNGQTDAQFEASYNASAPVVYIEPKTGAKVYVPRDQLQNPETVKKLVGKGFMPMNAYRPETTFIKGQ